MRKELAMCAALAITSVTSAASADEPGTFGFGSRGTAMGSAVSADAEGAAAGYYNPASLVAAKGLTFELGYVSIAHKLAINGKDTGVDPVRGVSFTFIAPGAIGPLPFAFSMGLYLPDDRVFRVRALDQSQPRWALYDNEAQRIWLSTLIALKPLSWLEIGGGLVWLANTHAGLDITGNVEITDTTQSQLRHQVDADLQDVRYPVVGVRILPRKDLRFALVYRGEYQLGLDIGAHLLANGTVAGSRVAGLETVLSTSSVNAFLPQQAVVGASWDPLPHATIDFDLTWVNWGRFITPVTAVKAHTRLIDAPPSFPFKIEDPAPTVIYPSGFVDRLVPRIGFEWRIPLSLAGHELALRAGYSYEKSPVPDQSQLTNYVDADRHAFSIGTGIKLHKIVREIPGDIRLDVHGQWSYLPDRTFLKDRAADLIGDYVAGGQIWNVGATMGVSFR